MKKNQNPKCDESCCICGAPAIKYLKKFKKWYCPICAPKAENKIPKPIIKPKEPLRNDKCPCNSGKKYKNCCLIKKIKHGINTR